MSRALETSLSGLASWIPPRGGFFLWVELPEDLTSDGVLPFAQARGVIYVIGAAFFVDGTGKRFMRLSFSSPPPERIAEGVARLGGAIADARAARAASASISSGAPAPSAGRA